MLPPPLCAPIIVIRNSVSCPVLYCTMSTRPCSIELIPLYQAPPLLKALLVFIRPSIFIILNPPTLLLFSPVSVFSKFCPYIPNALPFLSSSVLSKPGHRSLTLLLPFSPSLHARTATFLRPWYVWGLCVSGMAWCPYCPRRDSLWGIWWL